MKKQTYVRCDHTESCGDADAMVSVPTTFGSPVLSLRVDAVSVLQLDGSAFVPVVHLDSDTLHAGFREVLVEFTSDRGSPSQAAWVREDRLIEVDQ